MKLRITGFIFVFTLTILIQEFAFSYDLKYLSPLPDSKYNSEETNIIIGYSKKLPLKTLSSINLIVTGSKSGLHSGQIKFVENNSKLLFKPDSPFEPGETVTVKGYNNSESFNFYIRTAKIIQTYRIKDEPGISDFKYSTPIKNINQDKLNIDSLPRFVITNNGPTASGYIFISNFSNNSAVTSYLMILNNDGTPLFYRTLGGIGFDFKKQNDHLLTYYDEIHQKYLGIDDSYNIVDSFSCKNGYSTDFHEVRVMQDGSAWLLSYDPEYIDMSKIIIGGYSNALVTGLIVQKIKLIIFSTESPYNIAC